MLFPHPRCISQHLANAGGALLVGLLLAFVGLNAASGCGQPGGECIAVKDLINPSAEPQLAAAGSRDRLTYYASTKN